MTTITKDPILNPLLFVQNQIIMLLVLACTNNTISKIVTNNLHQNPKKASRGALQSLLMHVHCCGGFYVFHLVFFEREPKSYIISTVAM